MSGNITQQKSTVEVKRTDEKVWIDGVEGFSSSQCASSPHGCQARILQTLGESLSYDDLVCYGGFAFRAGWHQDGCPSAGHPCCGFDCVEISNKVLPWQVKIFDSFPWSEPKKDRAAFEASVCKAVKESIDRGIPVNYIAEEEGLIIGYADEGRRWRCVHPYHQDGKEAFWHDEASGFAGGKWPWAHVVWTEPKPEAELASDRDLTIAALEQAVKMWNTEKIEAYFTGQAAYEHWLQWLRDMDAGRIEDYQNAMQGNGWCFDVLIQNRRIAGRWLNEKADIFDKEAAKELKLAADHYAQIPELCLQDVDCSWNLALAPERKDDWTSEMRQSQIARLEAAREHDRAAIAAIEKALQSLNYR